MDRVDDERGATVGCDFPVLCFQPDPVQLTAERNLSRGETEKPRQSPTFEFLSFLFGKERLPAQRYGSLQRNGCLIGPDTLKIGIAPGGQLLSPAAIGVSRMTTSGMMTRMTTLHELLLGPLPHTGSQGNREV